MISKLKLRVAIKELYLGQLRTFQNVNEKLDKLTNYTIDHKNVVEIKDDIKVLYGDTYYTLLNELGNVFFYGQIDNNNLKETLNKDIAANYLYILGVKYYTEKNAKMFNAVLKEKEMLKRHIKHLVTTTTVIVGAGE